MKIKLPYHHEDWLWRERCNLETCVTERDVHDVGIEFFKLIMKDLKPMFKALEYYAQKWNDESEDRIAIKARKAIDDLKKKGYIK